MFSNALKGYENVTERLQCLSGILNCQPTSKNSLEVNLSRLDLRSMAQDNDIHSIALMGVCTDAFCHDTLHTETLFI